MEALTAVSVLLVCLDLISVVPQPVRVWKLRTTEGVSASSQAVAIGLCSTWCLYGVLRHDATQLVANGASIASYAAVLAAMVRFESLSPNRRTMTLVIAWCVLLAGVVHFFGVNGVAFIASGMSVVRRLPQALLAWRQPGGHGISLAALTLSLAASFAWIAYGIMQSDVVVLVVSSWAVTVVTFIAIRTRSGRLPLERRIEYTTA